MKNAKDNRNMSLFGRRPIDCCSPNFMESKIPDAQSTTMAETDGFSRHAMVGHIRVPEQLSQCEWRRTQSHRSGYPSRIWLLWPGIHTRAAQVGRQVEFPG